MSLFTLLSPYSEMPEMRSKSPAHQRRLLWQATNRRGDAIWVVPMLVAAGVAVVWAGMGFGAVRMIVAYQVARSPTGRADLPMNIIRLLAGAGVLLFIATWVLMYRMMVMRSLMFLLNRAGCPYCHFSLVGLKPESLGGVGAKPMIRCPECGEMVSLFDHGILPDDLLTDRQRSTPLPGAGPMGAYNTDDEVYRKRRRGRQRAGGKGASR